MASIWREPIFDRTSADIAFALQKISAWKQSHTHVADIKVENGAVIINEGETDLTDESIVLQTDGAVYVEEGTLYAELGCIYNLKGCLNLSDIIRIEDNISYIAEHLKQYRYPIAVDCKDWVQSDLPNVDDMKRIASNIRAICIGFVTPSGLLPMTDKMLSFEDINTLEYNLHLLKEMLDLMQGLFIKSGTQKCGATMKLPIRR